MRRRPDGFTLIELLLVVVIIGIITAIAIPKYFNSKEKAYDSLAVSELRNLITMSEAYFADHQQYPDDLDDLPEYTPSQGIVVDRFNRETTDGVIVVHIHLYHEASSHYYHVEYPVEQIEKRDRT